MSDFQPDAYPNCDPYANLNPTSFYTADSNTDFDIHLALTGRQDGTNYRDGSGYQDSTGYRDDYRDRTGYGDGTGYQDGTGPGSSIHHSFPTAELLPMHPGSMQPGSMQPMQPGPMQPMELGPMHPGPMQLMRPGQSVQPTTVQQSGSSTPSGNVSMRFHYNHIYLFHLQTGYILSGRTPAFSNRVS